ncbi:unnamed protein product [Heterobilharzia americana]|nr:unnamed protein product [Heterobilharzia americana]
MDQSIKLNQSCSPSPMQNKLVNGIQTKSSYEDCDYCHMPCNTQKLKLNAAPLNPIRDTPSMRGSLNTVENRQNVSGPLCRQITSSITPSNPLMSHYKSVGLQLTPVIILYQCYQFPNHYLFNKTHHQYYHLIHYLHQFNIIH